MLIGTIGYRFIKNRAWARSSVFEARVQIRRLRRQMTRIGISGAQSRESTPFRKWRHWQWKVESWLKIERVHKNSFKSVGEETYRQTYRQIDRSTGVKYCLRGSRQQYDISEGHSRKFAFLFNSLRQFSDRWYLFGSLFLYRQLMDTVLFSLSDARSFIFSLFCNRK